MTSPKYVRLIGEAGEGPVIVILRGGTSPSKSAALLAKAFRVVNFAVDPAAAAGEAAKELANTLEGMKVTHAEIVADTATGAVAIALASAHPELAQSVALLSPADVGDVSSLKVPVLALFGTTNAARSPGSAKALCKSIPNCRLVYVYDADRAVDDERPEAVAAALEDFAVRREGYLVNARSGNLYP